VLPFINSYVPNVMNSVKSYIKLGRCLCNKLSNLFQCSRRSVESVWIFVVRFVVNWHVLTETTFAKICIKLGKLFTQSIEPTCFRFPEGFWSSCFSGSQCYILSIGMW
jgi:hypothetical protein